MHTKKPFGKMPPHYNALNIQDEILREGRHSTSVAHMTSCVLHLYSDVMTRAVVVTHNDHEGPEGVEVRE